MWGRRERMAHQAAHLANTAYYQGLRARTRHGMQRLGATGAVKMHTAPNRFEIVVREMLIMGVCLCATACMVLAVELRDRGSDWAPVAFVVQACLFVLAGYIGYAVDRRGPMPRLMQFTNEYADFRIAPGYTGLSGLPMPTAKRGGIRYGEQPAKPPTLCPSGRALPHSHCPHLDCPDCPGVQGQPGSPGMCTEQDPANTEMIRINVPDPEARLRLVLDLLTEAQSQLVQIGIDAEDDRVGDLWADARQASDAARDGIQRVEHAIQKRAALLPCGCILPMLPENRGRTDLIDRLDCTEGHRDA